MMAISRVLFSFINIQHHSHQDFTRIQVATWTYVVRYYGPDGTRPNLKYRSPLVTHQFNFKFYIQFVFFFPWCSPPTQYPQLYNMNRVKANDEVAVMPNNAICVQSPKSHVLLADCFAEAWVIRDLNLKVQLRLTLERATLQYWMDDSGIECRAVIGPTLGFSQNTFIETL